MRLDQYLSSAGLVETRSKALNLIKLGNVTVNGKICYKPSTNVSENDEIRILSSFNESLGSYKLLAAIEKFNPEINKKICMDIGASNGGFTSVLLDNNASKVYAIDIGECAFSNTLKKNPKIKILDKTNARFMTRNMINDDIDIVVIDVSFISLKLILPSIIQFLKPNSSIITLIKPQFEVGAKYLTKNGIVKDKKALVSSVNDIIDFASDLKLKLNGLIVNPILFENKNIELLAYFTYENIIDHPNKSISINDYETMLSKAKDKNLNA